MSMHCDDANLDKSLLRGSEACPADHLQAQGCCEEVDACLISARQVLQPLSIAAAEAEEDWQAAPRRTSSPDAT